ncbi:hypothetical protein BDF20DRAFT_833600 [Mycotypha africana]|uniref:uncharacterized protein n=1 Tax=Mycotypha africana TaxID=64632 RepID=UPI0023001B33|nr:uncharacterized protein BDF20DRAFT_833600 [Mycotypha africana]KAI8984062.1 hypothetical protein BDF20DRAFT_833600 [Mycotypha africana]
MSTFIDPSRTSASNTNSFLYHNDSSSSPVICNSNNSSHQQIQQQQTQHIQQQQAQAAINADFTNTADHINYRTSAKPSTVTTSSTTNLSISNDDVVSYDSSIHNVHDRRISSSSINSSASSTSNSSTSSIKSGATFINLKKPVQISETNIIKDHHHQPNQQPSSVSSLKNGFHYSVSTATTITASKPSHTTKPTKLEILHDRPSICTTTNSRSFIINTTASAAANITPSSTAAASSIKTPDYHPHHHHSVITSTVPAAALADNSNTTPTKKKKKQSNQQKLQKRCRKERFAQVKNEYEQKIKAFYQQLTLGCQQEHCKNKFCASGRRGLMSLQPQAALILSIQLASMPNPDSRLCPTTAITQSDSKTISKVSEHKKMNIEKREIDKGSQEQITSKSFLQSLFNSSPFSGLFNNELLLKDKKRTDSINVQQVIYESRNEAQYDKQKRHRTTINGDNDRNNSWSTRFWKLLGYLDGNSTKENIIDLSEEDELDSLAGEIESERPTGYGDNEDVTNLFEAYYQIDDSDSSRTLIDRSSLSTESEEEDYFVILPTCVSRSDESARVLQLALNGDIPLKSLLKWCRSIFQNWEGIGNSFLLSEQQQQQRANTFSASLMNLEELNRFYQAFLPQQQTQSDLATELKTTHPKIKEQKEQWQLQLVETISNSSETLLDRMLANLDSLLEYQEDSRTQADSDAEYDKGIHTTIIEWGRSIIGVFEWMRCCDQMLYGLEKSEQKEENSQIDIDPFDEPDEGITALFTGVNSKKQDENINANATGRLSTAVYKNHIILNHKAFLVLSKIGNEKKSLLRKVLVEMIAGLDSSRVEHLVKIAQDYLSDHFQAGPYKHGLEDNVVIALKSLELIYHANMKIPSAPIISPPKFYNERICSKLNLKVEFRRWKQVLLYGEGLTNRRSNLLLPTTKPASLNNHRLFTSLSSTITSSPFHNSKTGTLTPEDYRFSWLSYPFILPLRIKRKIVLMDAMSQMSEEYEDACVNHTLLIHAQKLLTAAANSNNGSGASSNNNGMANFFRDKESVLRSATCPYLLLEIRREHFVQDTFVQLSQHWTDLKKPLKVKFVEGGEEGMDQGGVQKEFFDVLFKKLVSPSLGLFTQDDSTRLCWFKLHADTASSWTRLYEMMGVLMGLSVYNGVIMNLQFPKVLWKVMIAPNEKIIDVMISRGQLFTLEDLEEGWSFLAQGLRQLLDWDEEEQGGLTVEDIFCRDYDISMEVFGEGVVTTSLMPERKPAVPVTKENRDAYVRDYCIYYMYTAQKEQILALRRGLWSVLGSRALCLLTADELEMVACGLRQGPDAISLNMAELESVTEYDDGYSADHPTIRQFWSIVHHNLTHEQKKQLLLFVTASDRVPVGGLKELTFYIQRNGPDSDRLPTALTCFSRLLLPEYATKQKLRERLITAIENTQGFGLV